MERSGEYGLSVVYDELQAGLYEPVMVVNIPVDDEYERGTLLAYNGTAYVAATSSDVGKSLAIAAGNSSGDVIPAYVSGAFHREKIIAGSGVLEALELELRRQNIKIIGVIK